MVPDENPKVVKSGVASDVRFWNRAVFKNGHPKEMLSRWKIRKLEITGLERLSFLELCCFSKMGTINHFFRMKIRKWERSEWERVSFLDCCGFSKIDTRLKLCTKGNSQVGTSGLVATFVSGILRFLKNVLRMKVGPDEKSESSNERAGSDCRFWNCAVSQKMCS